ncbi:MAG: hypothetical protein ACK5JS_08080 [Mangrovibacterium sp.]
MKRLFKLFALVLLLHSCITRETDVTEETRIINESGHDVIYSSCATVSVSIADNTPTIDTITFKLSHGERFTKSYTDIGGANVYPINTDSISILFDNARATSYYRVDTVIFDSRNPYSEDAYVTEKKK